MVKMSAVWDRTSEVIAGRAGILASIALLFIWLPKLVQQALQVALAGPAGAAAASGSTLIAALIGLVAAAIGVIGQLSLVAVASDPAVSRREAVGIALARFWPYVGLILPLVIGFMLLLVPVAVVVAMAYPSLAAMRAGVMPALSPGTGVFVLVYMLAALVFVLWVEARLMSVLVPVILNERLGFASYARAFRLTRGLAWRIVGVVLLFGLVAGVAVIATQSLVGVVLRLALGASGAAAALFLTAAIVGLLACLISVVVSVFTAQLYVAAREARPDA